MVAKKKIEKVDTTEESEVTVIEKPEVEEIPEETVTIEVAEEYPVVEEPVEEPEIKIVAEEVYKARKNVRVKPNATYTTSIGGRYYSFIKGECQNVPEDVKRIMQEGGMLDVL